MPALKFNALFVRRTLTEDYSQFKLHCASCLHVAAAKAAEDKPSNVSSDFDAYMRWGTRFAKFTGFPESNDKLWKKKTVG